MSDIHHITYLCRHEIDSHQWDQCIDASVSPLIYGHSYYLDRITENRWDALIMDDYKAVMPLTWRSKFGIRYLYQPAFTQQTGIFSLAALSPSQIEAFLHQLDLHFRFAEIYLNHSNAYAAFERRTNYVVPLNAPYEQLSGQYKKDLTRNLKLAQRSSLYYKREVDPQTALHDFRREYAKRLPAIKEDDYRRFETLCEYLRDQDRLLTRTVLDEHQQPLCSALFLRDAHRFYLIHSTTPRVGRDTAANHFLLDQFIREFAGTPTILDFEGSDHPGIAHFYSNFGGVDQPYFFYRHNRLPWPVRWLK